MFIARSCPTLCDPTDYSPPGSSVHGILHARILEWVAIPFFRGSSQPKGLNFSSVQKEMATHSSVLAWRIPGTGEPGGLPSMGSHRVGHYWSDLAAAAALIMFCSIDSLPELWDPWGWKMSQCLYTALIHRTWYKYLRLSCVQMYVTDNGEWYLGLLLVKTWI